MAIAHSTVAPARPVSEPAVVAEVKEDKSWEHFSGQLPEYPLRQGAAAGIRSGIAAHYLLQKEKVSPKKDMFNEVNMRHAPGRLVVSGASGANVRKRRSR